MKNRSALRVSDSKSLSVPVTSFASPPTSTKLLADYEQFQVRLPEGDLTTRVARLGIDLAFSVTMSWRNLIQWDNETDELTVNSRFRWIIEPGREFNRKYSQVTAQD